MNILDYPRPVALTAWPIKQKLMETMRERDGSVETPEFSCKRREFCPSCGLSGQSNHEAVYGPGLPHAVHCPRNWVL